jgi:hypothetical protein
METTNFSEILVNALHDVGKAVSFTITVVRASNLKFFIFVVGRIHLN